MQPLYLKLASSSSSALINNFNCIHFQFSQCSTLFAGKRRPRICNKCILYEIVCVCLYVCSCLYIKDTTTISTKFSLFLLGIEKRVQRSIRFHTSDLAWPTLSQFLDCLTACLLAWLLIVAQMPSDFASFSYIWCSVMVMFTLPWLEQTLALISNDDHRQPVSQSACVSSLCPQTVLSHRTRLGCRRRDVALCFHSENERYERRW